MHSCTRIATNTPTGAELAELNLSELWEPQRTSAELKPGLGDTFIVNLFYFCTKDFKTYICGGTKKKWD